MTISKSAVEEFALETHLKILLALKPTLLRTIIPFDSNRIIALLFCKKAVEFSTFFDI